VTREEVEQVVLANRILAHRGVLDAFGHVSVRSRADPERFFLSRNRAPALIGPDDILELDSTGNVIGDDRPSYLERFIHSEIYSARPDVHAIVHSHAPDVIPFTVTAARLRPVMHVAGFLGAGVAHFDSRDCAERALDLLVSTPELGAALARALGDAATVLMRGHGFVTVADSLPLAVFQSVYAQVNARTQLQALSLGDVAYLDEAESIATRASNSSQVDRAWTVWSHDIHPTV
jgi:HCOMODA/2-hydroxy-3-carboxy-muconic semialdehyde decarboxylase